MHNYLEERKDTGLCESLLWMRLKYQSMTKLETKHILQAQVCDCISTKKRNEDLVIHHKIK